MNGTVSTRSTLADLMGEFVAEIEALQVERDAALEKAERASGALEIERARQRKHLRLLREALEADMQKGKGHRPINPIGAERVLAWLDRHERSQRWLAGRVNVSGPHLGLVLRGEREPSRDLLNRIAAETGIDAGALAPVAEQVAS